MKLLHIRRAYRYLFAPQETLSQATHRARINYEFKLVDVFKRLKKKKKSDPEVASAVLDLWANILKAAEFMATPAPGLGGKSPLQAVEEGERQRLLDLIYQLKQGNMS